MDSIEAKNRGRPCTPNRQGQYAKIVKYADTAISVLVDLLKSRNENIRLGAARTLLDKILPDVKAVAVQEDIKLPMQITALTGNGFIPPLHPDTKVLTE